jgi:drug/metabolite transporter (DMT)-like permease
MKLSYRGLTAPQIAGVRIFSAGLVFLPVAILYISRIPRQKIGYVALSGMLGNLFPGFLFAIAVMKIDSAVAGILNSLTPICVVLIGTLFFKNKIGVRKLTGILIGLAGLCLLTATQKDISLHNLGYSLMILLATIFYGLNVNMVSHYLKGIKPLHSTAVSLAFMMIPAGLALWYFGFFDLNISDPVIYHAIFFSVVLGIGGSAIATLLYYSLIQSSGGLFASLVTYCIPFVAMFWGIIYGEHMGVLTLPCLLMILVGVYMANRPEKAVGN